MSNKTRIEQGGRPSCWWVPSPALAGDRFLATHSGVNIVNAIKTANTRVRVVLLGVLAVTSTALMCPADYRTSGFAFGRNSKTQTQWPMDGAKLRRRRVDGW